MVARLGRWRASYKGVACPRCHAVLRHATLRSGEQTCPACNGLFEAVRFDPVEPRVVVPDLAGTGPEGAAPCTRHARNQAEVACSRCGQFMCSLCRIDADGKTYCPPCYERLSAEGTLVSAVTRVRNWAGWVALCLLGSLFSGFFMAAVLGPLGIFCCVRGLKEKKLRGETDGIARLYLLLFVCLLVSLGGVLLYVGLFGAFKGMD
jgi:hypothetical protein